MAAEQRPMVRATEALPSLRDELQRARKLANGSTGREGQSRALAEAIENAIGSFCEPNDDAAALGRAISNCESKQKKKIV